MRPFPTASQLPWASSDSFRTNSVLETIFYLRKRRGFSTFSENVKKRRRLRKLKVVSRTEFA